MAIKDFMLKNSYSRIERVSVMKDVETVDYYLTVYKDDSKKEILAKDIRFTTRNDIESEKMEYDSIFKEALKENINVLKICYSALMCRPEFINTMEV